MSKLTATIIKCLSFFHSTNWLLLLSAVPIPFCVKPVQGFIGHLMLFQWSLDFSKGWQGTNRFEPGIKPVPYGDHTLAHRTTVIHTWARHYSLPMQRGPLSAVLPGTFGGGESDQAPMSIQSTRGSSVPANYSSHLIWEGEGGETDEGGRRGGDGKSEGARGMEGGETGDQWDLCFLTGTMNHMQPPPVLCCPFCCSQHCRQDDCVCTLLSQPAWYWLESLSLGIRH